MATVVFEAPGRRDAELTARELTAAPCETGQALPQVVHAPEPGLPLIEQLPALKQLIERRLEQVGALLFRGFESGGVGGFRQLAERCGGPLLSYDFASTPRTHLEAGVYSSTEYPAHQHIPLHNEQSYARTWPMKIWFYCEVAPVRGGETPIADSRQLYERVPRAARERLLERGLMYVRNFGAGLDVPWQQAFGTADRARVEAYCSQQGIACEWKPDGELRTRQRCQVVARHPRTHELVWFNQAHLFHVSALEPEVRSALLDAIEPEDLPRNVYYADGSEIEVALLDDVRATLSGAAVSLPWRVGDVLLLDNMLVAHARNPFEGPRKIAVAMAEAHSEAR